MGLALVLVTSACATAGPTTGTAPASLPSGAGERQLANGPPAGAASTRSPAALTINVTESVHGHSLALKSDGTLRAWGRNASGELGDGTTTDRSTPVQVSGLSSVTALAAGGNAGDTEAHSLAVKSDGTVWAWGSNSNGQLGDGTTTGRSTPVQVSGLSGVSGVAASYRHSLALKSDGTVRGWGFNQNYQLGDSTTTDRSTPVQVSGLTGVTAVAAGSYHGLARVAQ